MDVSVDGFVHLGVAGIKWSTIPLVLGIAGVGDDRVVTSRRETESHVPTGFTTVAVPTPLAGCSQNLLISPFLPSSNRPTLFSNALVRAADDQPTPRRSNQHIRHSSPRKRHVPGDLEEESAQNRATDRRTSHAALYRTPLATRMTGMSVPLHSEFISRPHSRDQAQYGRSGRLECSFAGSLALTAPQKSHTSFVSKALSAWAVARLMQCASPTTTTS